MSSQVTRFTPSGGVGKAHNKRATSAPSQRSTEEVQWKSITLDLDRFADVFERGLPGTQVAWSGGNRQGSTVKRSSGVVQVKTLWAAVEGGFDVWVLERPLEKVGGKHRPQGEWKEVDHQTYRFAPGATKRTGKVASKTSTSTITSSEDGGQRLSAEMSNGMETLSFLPSQVQRGLLSAVPRPHLLSGHLLQRGGSTIEVDLLAFDGTSVVVLHASAPAQTTNPTWEVTQLSATVTQPRPALGGGTRLQIGNK